MRPFGPPIEILGIEFLYFIIVFSLCLIIYFRTRDIYKLTKHTGIFHFRNIFLYFSLAYLFRLLHVGIIFHLFSFRFPMMWHPVSLLVVGYFSTMAILSVVMASFVRKTSQNKFLINSLLNIIAIALSVVVFLTRSPHIMVIIQAVVFLIAFFFVLKKNVKGFMSKTKIIYTLLFVFWVINVLLFARGLVPIGLRIPLYVLSVGVFISIFIKVQKRLKVNAKKKR